MRLESRDESRIVVTVKKVARDNRETIPEVNEATGKPTGRQVKNERFGKLVYETVENGTVDVYEATGAEVLAAVHTGLKAAAAKK